jgi:very-short-patch-repair endonuclease
MAAKSSNPKLEHKSRSCYPIVLLPVLIQEHLPRQVVTEKSVPVEPQSIVQPSALVSRYYQGYLLAFWVSLLAVILRFFNVYTHNGVAVASAVVMAIAIVCLGKELDDHEAVLFAKQRRTALAMPQFQTIKVKQWQVADWQRVLTDRVRPHLGVSDAQIGASEPEFAKYLQQYFGTTLKPSYTFSIRNSKLVYSADFCLVLPSGLSFCIEIDEPYVWDTGEPHHCIDQGKDAPRDNFFLAGNWVTIRFSEKQIILEPVACCFLIAKTVDRLTGDSTFTSQFKDGTTAPQLDPQWTIAEAQAMANTKYRSSYRPQKGSSQLQQKKVAKPSLAQISM